MIKNIVLIYILHMSDQTEFSVDNLSPVDHDVEWSKFDYPIGAFTGYYTWNDGEYTHQDGHWNCGPVIGEEKSNVSDKDMMDYKQFEKVYYAKPGMNDEENWTFLVKHKNGYYIFFDAGCDFTGFDCQGGGNITYSLDGQKMWTLGLTNDMRNILKP